ncbi:MAG: discoidin domain-containing protein, partial [Flavobacteriales bacterium]
RQESHLKLLNNLGVKPGLAAHPFQVTTIADPVSAKIYTPIKKAIFSYSWNDEPFSILELRELHLPIEQSGLLHLKLERADGYLAEEELLISHHRALGCPPVLQNPYSEWYTAGGENGLVDGLKASNDFRDGRWQGFWGTDLEAVIELKEEQIIESVDLSFYQYVNAWIFVPTAVEIHTSEDGINWKLAGSTKPTLDQETRGKLIEDVSIELPGINAKWMKVKAKNVGKVPDWHEAAGADAWIFIDEISVK